MNEFEQMKNSFLELSETLKKMGFEVDLTTNDDKNDNIETHKIELSANQTTDNNEAKNNEEEFKDNIDIEKSIDESNSEYVYEKGYVNYDLEYGYMILINSVNDTFKYILKVPGHTADTIKVKFDKDVDTFCITGKEIDANFIKGFNTNYHFNFSEELTLRNFVKKVENGILTIEATICPKQFKQRFIEIL